MGIDPYVGCNLTIPSYECTLKTCCLAQSSFNYLPSFGGNLFFCVYFGIFIVIQLLGLVYRTWGFTIGLVLGLVLEVLAYASRIQLHDNPFLQNPFLVYLVCVTIAPVFISAGIYLCLARIVIVYGEDNSRFKPRTIAITFMSSDFCSLVLQALGGGIADTATHGGEAQHVGIDIMIAGLVLQVVSLTTFLIVLGDFGLSCRKGMLDMDVRKVQLRRRLIFRGFVGAIVVSTALILIRSIYRVIELWQGFNGSIWNNETDFMVLDGAMIGLAVLLLTMFHPGLAFAGKWQDMTWSFKKSVKRGTHSQLVEGSEQVSSGEHSMETINKAHQ